MSNTTIQFGTDGWRGILDEEVNNDTMALAAQAFADYLNNNASVNPPSAIIGFDGRSNSDEFAKLFAGILSGNGITTFLSESITPTPVLSYYVKCKSLDAGVMITASHNPAKYSGIKFKGSYGGPFLTEETLAVESFLGKSKIIRGTNYRTVNLFPPYFSQLLRYIDFNVIRNSKLCIAIDSMGGAGERTIENILSNNGITSTTIFGLADTNFSGRAAEPIEKNLKPLAEELQSNDYAFGAATDGDADRAGFMLETGEWLSAQDTILLLIDYCVNRKQIPGDIVKTASVTDKVRRFETAGRQIHDVQVGFKYICETMLASQIAIGCEESGGYGFANHIPERDGILSTLLFLEMLAIEGFDKLSSYLQEKRKQFGTVYYKRIDKEYIATDRTAILPGLAENPPSSIAGFIVKSTRQYNSSRGIINGLKFYLSGKNRWLLIRSSETEPLFRYYSEAESDDETNLILNAAISLIEKNN